MSYFIQKAQHGTKFLQDEELESALERDRLIEQNRLKSQIIDPQNKSNPVIIEKEVPAVVEKQQNDEKPIYGNIIDRAEIGRGGGLFGRMRDSKILAQRGFKYFDPDTGTFQEVGAGALTARDVRKQAREAARREDIERRYGLSDTTGWNDEAIKYRQNEVKTDNRYFTRNNNNNSIVSDPSEKKTYRYGFTNDNTGFGNAAIEYLNGLYNNKNYEGLNTILGNGTIFNSNNFGNFLSSKWNSGTNSFNDDFLGTLTDDQAKIFGNYMKSRSVPGITSYDLSTPEGVKKFQQDNGIKVDGLIGPQTRNAINNWNTQYPNQRIDINNNWSTIYHPSVRNLPKNSTQSTKNNTPNTENESSNVGYNGSVFLNSSENNIQLPENNTSNVKYNGRVLLSPYLPENVKYNGRVFLGNTEQRPGSYLGGTPVLGTTSSGSYLGNTPIFKQGSQPSISLNSPENTTSNTENTTSNTEYNGSISTPISDTTSRKGNSTPATVTTKTNSTVTPATSSTNSGTNVPQSYAHTYYPKLNFYKNKQSENTRTYYPELDFYKNYKQGGQMKYFQTGGAINQQQVAQEQAQSQQAQLNEIFQAIAQNPKETLAALQQQGIQPKQIIDIAKKMAEQKNPAAIEALNALQQMSQMAKQGAKLAYVKKLRGECPDGMEMHYYKVGGVMCKKCMQKIEAEKCGGKTKKKKCGGEIKKNSKGGECSTVSEFKNKRNCK